MYINASVFRKIENTLWKNLPESRHYDDIRRKLFQIFHTCIFPDFYRLEYFQSMGNRTFLYRWKLHGIPASLWFVRLCNHKHNLVSGFYDLFQCIHRKIRCSHKNYFHIIPLPAPHNSHHEVRLLLFCIHMSIQMIQFMANAACHQTFAFYFPLIHVQIIKFCFYMVRTCNLTCFSRKT